MTTVGVIGGGTAGAEAAAEGSRLGAEVTVFERSTVEDPSWSSWPELIRTNFDSSPASSGARHPPSSGVTTRSGEVTSAGPGFILEKSGSRNRFDSVVVATGCDFRPTVFSGSRKVGVTILDSSSKYAELGRTRGTISRALVWGEGARVLEVADRLAGEGRRLGAAIPFWGRERPSTTTLAAILRAAAEKDVFLVEGEITKAIGTESLEAVLVGGRVYSIDSLVVIPSRTPRTIPIGAIAGKAGGLAVDRYLMTSVPSVFAAGGCAERASGSFSSAGLENEPRRSGRVAGANSAGKRLSYSESCTFEVTAFGVRWTRVGTPPGRTASFEVPVGIVTQEWSRSEACTIVYEQKSGNVLAIECVEEARSPRSRIPFVAPGRTTLQSLAYHGSTDISLVSDTARLGLRDWSDSSSAITWRSNISTSARA